MSSTCAGVYSEYLVKGSKDPLPIQNLLLYSFGIALMALKHLWSTTLIPTYFGLPPSAAAAAAVATASSSPASAAAAAAAAAAGGGTAASFFAGWTTTTYVLVLTNTSYGFVISVIFKYADNIVKVYATAMSFLLTTVVSGYLLGTAITSSLVFGGMVVVISMYTYYCNHSDLLLMDSVWCGIGAAVGAEDEHDNDTKA